MITPDLESPRPPAGDGASDAITCAFGDPRADVYGVARLGLADGAASGLVLLFHGGEPVAVSAEGGVAVPGGAGWEAVSAAGLDTAIVEPLRRWRLRYAGDEAAFDLDVEALGEPAELDPGHPAARAGGMTGYEQLCRVRGSVTAGGRRLAVDGLGQRGHSWGAPDWEAMSVARSLSAWIGDDLAVTLTAVRPARADAHGRELVAATILEAGAPAEGGERAAGVRPLPVGDPRLSTTYDADGRQRHAGLELWVDEDGHPRRVAGEAVCGTTLDLGRLRLDCAFFRWHMEGREGVGRYDVLRRAS
ncbi:MAG TPA: hypothetical protein VLA98_02970 [Solirubrobacteraceae bacterium]|nr:hypothetical protein [Solirubrobacteraceae bacterium]